ncbi:hypothetical protein ACFYZE_12845 [Streptomyces sp. NPDC001796]|uniref:hypothetical protein n=1 Tax=Streptomyces sp. NPDC001796 TaxID=3364609 RepID=UPI0036AEDABD
MGPVARRPRAADGAVPPPPDIATAERLGARVAEQTAFFLASRPVLWFLFLFNGAVAAFCAVAVDGTQGLMAAAGMGVVSLGSGFGLLQKRGRPQPERA